MQNNNCHRFFKWIFILFALECVASLLWIITTPTDQKNALLLGFSLNRWLMIVFTLVLAGLSIFVMTKSTRLLDRIIQSQESKFQGKPFAILTAVSLVVFWFSIWLSPQLLPKHTYEIERLKPVLVLVAAVISEFLLFFFICSNTARIKTQVNAIEGSKAQRYIFWSAFLVIILLFVFLKFLGRVPGDKSLSFPPGVPVTPIQWLGGLLIFFLLLIMDNAEKTRRGKKIWMILVPLFIWAISFTVWASTPFTCADDRPGPYLPNNVCYPQVDDSVYSIGSHYITLGRGVFNHWFTDKPFYMLFLAFTQVIAGPHIDHYLLAQTALLALIPVVLFFLGRRFAGVSGGFLLAYSTVIMGVNNIQYYATTGGINVKLENSEILTSLLLILFCAICVQFFHSQGKHRWALLAGGLLGLATLTRMNPVFIVPGMFLFLLVIFWKHWRKWLISSLVLLIGFSVVFVPWLFFARDAQGHNYYLQKIENVLFYRYRQQSSIPAGGKTAADAKNEPVSLVRYEKVTATNALPYMSDGGINSSELTRSQVTSQVSNVIYHFLNNEFISIAKLPVNLRIIPMEEILKQSLWSESHRLAFWKLNLSFENYLALTLSLIVVMLGIRFAFRGWGMVGLLPLMIQLFYHLANGFALTSGERYLEPVEWVTVLYFVLGIYSICQVLIPGLTGNARFHFSPETVSESLTPRSFLKSRTNLVVLAGLIVMGALLPATYIIPDQFNGPQDETIVDYTKNVLVQNKYAKWKDLQTFLQDPKSIVVEGYAYHPRVYRSPLVLGHQEVFELTVLGADRVYISNMLKFNPTESFKDGTHVVLLGCRIKEKNFWGAKSVMMRTIGYITVENDQVFKNKWAKLKCP